MLHDWPTRKLIPGTVVLYDVDMTLADSSHRNYLLPAGFESQELPESAWAEWNAAAELDTPVPGMLDRLHLDWLSHLVHIYSSRRVTCIDQTAHWLEHWSGPWFDHIQFRAPGDTRPAEVLKVEHINRLIAQGLDPVLAYEDKPDQASYIREQTGIPLIEVGPCG